MRNGDWMQTYTGKQFWPIDPSPDDVCVDDIAHALSMMCRYNGHCKWFYSVAEHSVYVSRHVPKEFALWGLLHDAPEAYVADIVKPAKRFISGYADVEKRIMRAVCEKFGLNFNEPASVKLADASILADEMAQVMGNAPAEWSLPYAPLGQTILGLDPSKAKRLFLDRYSEITGG